MLTPALLLVLAASPTCPLQAQAWHASIEIGAARFSGGAEEGDLDRFLLPYRPTVFGVGLERRGARIGLGLRLHYAESSLALEGSEALSVIKGALTVYGASPEISTRLLTFGAGPGFRASAGPLLEVWDLADQRSHFRLGAQAGITLEVPLSSTLTAGVRGQAAVTPSSPFDGADLEPGFARRALWRRAIAAELQYRL